jgi:hypothetical protein
MAAAALKDAAGGSKNVARTSLRISASKAALVRNDVQEGLKKRDKDGRHRKAGLFVHRRDISSPALDVGTFFIELRSIHCAWAGNATSRPKASERCLAGARL